MNKSNKLIHKALYIVLAGVLVVSCMFGFSLQPFQALGMPGENDIEGELLESMEIREYAVEDRATDSRQENAQDENRNEQKTVDEQIEQGPEESENEPIISKWGVDVYKDAYLLSGKSAYERSASMRDIIPEIACERLAVIDGQDKFAFGKNASARVKIASLTKIMTAIVACDYDLNIPVIVTPLAAHTIGSFCGIVEGDQTTLRELLVGLMLPSGNDAAYAIAGACGKMMLEADGANQEDIQNEEMYIKRFVLAMNDKAKELGCVDTLFVNPCGLDDEGFEGEHVSSAYDVALMTKAAYKIDDIRDIVGQREMKMNVTRDGLPYEIPLTNTNRLLEQNEDACGMKTGFTDAAGSCVACVFEDKGEVYVVCVLGSDTSDESFAVGSFIYDWIRQQQVRADALSFIREYNVFNDENHNELVDGSNGKRNNEREFSCVGSIAHRDWLDKTFSVGIDNSQEMNYVRYVWEDDCQYVFDVSADDNAKGDVKLGDKMGEIRVLDGEGIGIGTVDVIATEDCDGPGFIDGVATFFTRLWNLIIGNGINQYAQDGLYDLSSEHAEKMSFYKVS